MTRLRILVSLPFVFATLATMAGCVNVDPKTDEVIPRGSQRYEFDEVTQNAEKLKEGLSKFDVMMLLGTPAEKDGAGDVWVYVPERPAIIVPGKALRLQFRNGRLAEFGYRAIVLGQRL